MSSETIAAERPARVHSPARDRLVSFGLRAGRQIALTIVAIGLFVYFSISAPHFLSTANIFDMAKVGAFLLIVAVPMTMLFIAQQLDLSIGSVYALCAILMAVAIAEWGMSLWLGAAVAILVGVLVGAINGFVTQFIGVPAFIATLAGFSLFRGLAIGIAGGNPIYYDSGASGMSFASVSDGTLFGNLPNEALWALVVFLVGGFILRYTVFGAHVYATGGNELASQATGIRTRKVKFLLFVATGAAVGLTAALQGGWLLQGDPGTGNGFELQVIAAVIIGGVAIQGGSGGLYGTLLGVAIVGMLANGLVLQGVGANWTQFYVGLLIGVVATAEVAINRRDDVRRLFRRSWREMRRR